MNSINHTEMTLVAVSPHHVSTVLKLAGKIPTLKVIVAMADLPAESKKIYEAWGEQVGIKVMYLPECELPRYLFDTCVIVRS